MWRSVLVTVLFALVAPVWAFPVDSESNEEKPAGTQEKSDSPDKKAEKPADAKTDKDKAEESPIKRLVELRLDEFVVPARAINIPLPGRTRTLQEVMDRLDEWSKDEKVGAILLDVGDLGLALPDIEELRSGVARVREKGKKVTAFFNSGSDTAYLLACAADEIVMAPTGSLMVPGIGRVFPYMKGHYQMLGLEFDVISAGRFKYPGFLNDREPNQYFREEFNAILDSWIADYKNIIADHRKLSPEVVTEVVNTALFDANAALQRGLVDHLAYYDECRERVLRRDKLKRYKTTERGLAEVHSLQDFMELINDQMRSQEEARKAVGPKIAVLHARGPIIDQNLGAGMASQIISRDPFVEVVDELRRNKSIKAVVMRVDSPGGSGYASDVIWQELRRLNEEKPLVVSMGTVAGSGGYYIACPARRIFAQPTTITGSIGVLGIFQMAESQLNRADMNLFEMKRGDRAVLGSPHKTMAKEDRQFLQDYINDFYGVFVERVATTRRLPVAEVRKIAEGRIYTGRQAKEIGLIDELGGLAEAIESARDMANIPDSAELKIVHYPRSSSFGELFESLGAVSMEQVMRTASLAMSPAPMMSFDQQVRLFSQTFKPLCWMGIPSLSFPSPATGLMTTDTPVFRTETLP